MMKLHIFYPLFLAIIMACITHVEAVKDIYVIGGGLAGLTAARKLTNKAFGEYQVTVLEGRLERYGGRVWTDRFRRPKAVGLEAELGGNFLPENSRILEFAAASNISLMQLAEFAIFDLDGNKHYIGKDATELKHKLYKEINDALARAADNGDDQGDLWSAVEKNLQVPAEEFNLYMQFLKSMPPASIDGRLASMFNPLYILGKPSFTADGTDEIPNRLAGGHGIELPLEIELNTVVRQIEICNVTNKVKIRTVDMQQYEADAVIVTLPVVMLQEGQLVFEPSLPQNYQQALSYIGYAGYNRVVFEFNKVFWPEDLDRFIVIRESSDDEHGLFTIWTNVYKFLKTPYLLADISAQMADQFEDLADEEVKSKALALLVKLFGAEKVGDSEIVSILRSNWREHGDSMGAFSYPKKGCTEKHFDILEEPICPFIYLAGEYTHRHYMGSLEGAYLSGLRAADQVLSGHCEKSEGKSYTDTAHTSESADKDEL